MKSFRYLVVLFLLLFAGETFAQSRIKMQTYDDFIQLKQIDRSDKGYLRVADIAGSPYLNKNFQEGSVTTTGEIRYMNIPLRYNIYTGEVEFRDKNGESMNIKFPKMIKEIKIGDTTFVYRSYLKGGKTRNEYFQILNKGKAEGLIRYSIGFQPSKPAGAYKAPQPPTFVRYPPSFYVSVANRPAVEVHRTKTLIKLLDDHKKALQVFAKKKNIKIQRVNDLKQILNYYNTLKN